MPALLPRPVPAEGAAAAAVAVAELPGAAAAAAVAAAAAAAATAAAAMLGGSPAGGARLAVRRSPGPPRASTKWRRPLRLRCQSPPRAPDLSAMGSPGSPCSRRWAVPAAARLSAAPGAGRGGAGRGGAGGAARCLCGEGAAVPEAGRQRHVGPPEELQPLRRGG